MPLILLKTKAPSFGQGKTITKPSFKQIYSNQLESKKQEDFKRWVALSHRKINLFRL